MGMYEKAVISALLLTLSTATNGDASIVEHESNYCYAYAMIGKDSVINSRLGLLPEDLIEIARVDSFRAIPIPRYSTALLRTILDAFLWQESPQHYAHTIMENCDIYRSKEGKA